MQDGAPMRLVVIDCRVTASQLTNEVTLHAGILSLVIELKQDLLA